MLKTEIKPGISKILACASALTLAYQRDMSSLKHEWRATWPPQNPEHSTQKQRIFGEELQTSTATQTAETPWVQSQDAPRLTGIVNMQKTQNQALKLAVGAGILVLTIWGGVVSLTAILDYYGFGPNTQTQQDRIGQNLRRLEGQSSDQPYQPNANQ